MARLNSVQSLFDLDNPRQSRADRLPHCTDEVGKEATRELHTNPTACAVKVYGKLCMQVPVTDLHVMEDVYGGVFS
jgi:hypothetical protein